MRRVLVCAVAVVVGLAGLVGSAPRATAASSWWVPTSWISAAVGTVAAVKDYLSGGSASVAAPVGVTIGSYGSTPSNYYGLQKIEPVLSGSTLVWHRAGSCIAGSINSSGCESVPAEGALVSLSSGQTITCVNGVSGPYGQMSSGVVYQVGDWCSGRGGLAKFQQTAGSGPTAGEAKWWPAFTWTLRATESMRTELTCRAMSTGVDTVVSETSTSGVAPAPVCPAGTVPVRVRVLVGSTVLQDASITSAALGQYGAYLGDPGGWAWELWRNGVQCVVGDQICDESASGGDPGDTSCVLIPPDSTMAITLSTLDCSEARENGQVGTDPGSSGGGEGWNPLKVAIDLVAAAVKAVKNAVDAVRGVLNGIRSAIEDGIGSIIEGIQSIADRIIEAIHEVRDAIEDGVRSIVEKLQGLLDQGGGDGGGHGESCTTATCGGGPGGLNGGGPGPGWKDLGEKFEPLQDALDELTGSFNPAATGSCRGPGIPLPPYGGTVYPLDACAEPMRGVAEITRVIGAVYLILGAVMLIIRMLAAAWGLNIDLGRGE